MTVQTASAGLLLDTHVALWITESADRLDASTRRLLDEPDGPVYVSAVSIVEIAIKISLGKLRVPGAAVDVIAAAGCDPLDLTAEHASHLAGLPPLHRDPFDRLLISQAVAENLVLVTADRRVLDYPDVQLHRVN